MKLWKKLMACTLAAVLALGVLTGCGQKVVMTDSFVNMLNRHLAWTHSYKNQDGVDISGANVKLTEGSEYSKEANALLDKYVAAYQSWLKTDPILKDEKPDIDDIAAEMDLGKDYIVASYATKGTKDLVMSQCELEQDVAGDMADYICNALEEYPDKTFKTVTVAEKQVDDWYYLVAVTKPVNK